MKQKILNILPEVFQKGKVVVNPESWKRGQVTTNVLASFLATMVSFASIFGYDIPVTQEQLVELSSWFLGGVGVYNTIVTIVSTDKIGI